MTTAITTERLAQPDSPVFDTPNVETIAGISDRPDAAAEFWREVLAVAQGSGVSESFCAHNTSVVNGDLNTHTISSRILGDYLIDPATGHGVWWQTATHLGPLNGSEDCGSDFDFRNSGKFTLKSAQVALIALNSGSDLAITGTRAFVQLHAGNLLPTAARLVRPQTCGTPNHNDVLYIRDISEETTTKMLSAVMRSVCSGQIVFT